MKTVLVQGAGGGGGNNLIRSLRAANHELRILGTNCVPTAVAKSTADQSFMMPLCTQPDYLEKLQALIEAEGIELVIPNSDRETGAVSRLRDQLPCRVFLPPDEVVRTCHDKHALYRQLSAAGYPMAPSASVEEAGSIRAAFERLPPGERYWVRPRVGSGSKGATWVRTVEQAEAWIGLWSDLRGVEAEQFQVCSWLGGRDYCFQSTWKDGELVLAKLVERLQYFLGANRLSGMSSTPALARTLRDEAALETAVGAVRAICPRPHGNFSMDMKGDAEGRMHVTEVNIGRFCMITTIFDSTGKHSNAEAYVRSAFDLQMPIEDPMDIDEGWLLIRDLDTEPLVIHESELPKASPPATEVAE